FMNVYLECIREAKAQDAKENLIKENVKKYNEIVNMIFEWVVAKLKIRNLFADGISDVDLLEKKEMLTGNLSTYTVEGNTLVNKAVAIKEQLRLITEQDEADMLICVETSELKQLVQNVLMMIETQLQGIVEIVDTRNNFQERKQEIDKIISENEKLVCQRHASIMSEFCAGPVSAEYFTRRFTELQILNEQSIELCRKRGEKSGEVIAAIPPWETFYNFWERVISISQTVVNHLKNCVLKKQSFEENFEKAKKWHEAECQYAKNVLRAEEFVTSEKTTLMLELPSSHEFYNILLRITGDLLHDSTNVSELGKNLLATSKDLKNAVLEVKSNIAGNRNSVDKTVKNANDFAFGFIQNCTPYADEKMEEGMLSGDAEFIDKLSKFYDETKKKSGIEENREIERKKYSSAFNEYVTCAKDILSAERVNFVSLKTSRNDFGIMQECISKETEWVNKYVDYGEMKESVSDLQKRITDKGLTKKDEKSDKSVEKQGEKSDKVESKDESEFLDSNNKFRREALLDVSPMQQREFHREFITMIQSVNDLSLKLSLLLSSEKKTRDTHVEVEDIQERVYSLAIEAIRSPQLHFTWMCELSQKLKKTKLMIEHGLCEVAIVYYLFKSLYGDNVAGDYEKLLFKIAPDFLVYEPSKISTGVASAFTDEKMVNHGKYAIEAFKEGGAYSHAECVCEFLLAHFMNMNDLSQIITTHQQIEELYTSLNESGKKLEMHFYNVIVSNDVEMNSNSTEKSVEYIYASKLVSPDFLKYIEPLSRRSARIQVREVFPVINGKVVRQPQSVLTPTDEFMLESDIIGETIEDTTATTVEYKTHRKLPSLLSRTKVMNQNRKVLTPCEKTIVDLKKLYEALDSVFSVENTIEREVEFETVIPILRFILKPTQYTGLLTVTQVFFAKEMKMNERGTLKELYEVVCNMSVLCKKVLDKFESNHSKEVAVARKDYFNFAMFIKSIEDEVLAFFEMPNEEA
ncbi:hypothetical protein EIN_282250, partial [Entamoeba invadens IP1]